MFLRLFPKVARSIRGSQFGAWRAATGSATIQTEPSREFLKLLNNHQLPEDLSQFCKPNATFHVQGEVLAALGLTNCELKDYVEWHRAFQSSLVNYRVQVLFEGFDAEAGNGALMCTIEGKCPKMRDRCAYHCFFHLRIANDGRIESMCKVWDGTVPMRQLGRMEGEATQQPYDVQALASSSGSIREAGATAFFGLCEEGAGWEAVKRYCSPEASFNCLTDVLAQMRSLKEYVEWMKVSTAEQFTDFRSRIHFMGSDQERSNMLYFATFQFTTPEGKQLDSHFVYLLYFTDDQKISHMTKIWNAPWALTQLGIA